MNRDDLIWKIAKLNIAPGESISMLAYQADLTMDDINNIIGYWRKHEFWDAIEHYATDLRHRNYQAMYDTDKYSGLVEFNREQSR